MAPDFLKARRAWIDVLQVLEDDIAISNYSTQQLMFIINGERKTFHDKNKFSQFLSNSLALEKALEGKLQSDEKVNYSQEETRNKNPKTVSQKRKIHTHHHHPHHNRSSKIIDIN